MRAMPPPLIITALSSLLVVGLAVGAVVTQLPTTVEGQAHPLGQNEVALAAGTRVLDERSRENLVDVSESTLEFSDTAPEDLAFAVGDVVVSEPTATAPGGFMRKVTGISPSRSGVMVETELAGLDEALTDAALDLEQDLRPEDLISYQIHLDGAGLGFLRDDRLLLDWGDGELEEVPGCTEIQTPEGEFIVLACPDNVDSVPLSFSIPIPEVLLADKVKLAGLFEFSATATVKLKLTEKLGVREFQASLSGEEKAKFTVNAPGTTSLKGQVKPVASLLFGPYVFMAGEFPIVWSVKVELTVGADGEIKVGLSALVEQEFSGAIGARYTGKNGWENLSNAKFNATGTLQAGDKTKLTAHVSPTVTFQIYGVDVAFARAKAFGELDVSAVRAELGGPYWKITAGFKAELGIDVKVDVKGLRLRIVKFGPWTVVDQKKVINGAKDEPSQDPPPEPEPGPSGGNAVDLAQQAEAVLDEPAEQHEPEAPEPPSGEIAGLHHDAVMAEDDLLELVAEAESSGDGPLTFEWTAFRGEESVLLGAGETLHWAPSDTFGEVDEPYEVELRLLVTDAAGNTDSDTRRITVDPAS